MNSNNELSQTSRAMLVGALLGGTASSIKHWREYQQGDIDIEQAVSSTFKDATKAGGASGVVTAVAGNMSGRPLLSALSILAVGAAGMYLLDEIKESNDEQQL